MKVSTDKAKIELLLTRGVEDAIVEESLREKLMSGKQLRIKLGVDPTAPDLHLGHAIAIRKLKEFQDLGHQVVFIIGDYTAKVGDPSGRSKTRPMLSDREIKANAKTYMKQAGKILDVKKAEIRWNSSWFKRLRFDDILRLASDFTVARMIERDDFAKRLKEGSDIHMHELLYPMMQAYDSAEVMADVEIGGRDQKFNILAGRELQKKIGDAPQDILLLGPILVGTDGHMKMSKSFGNYIGITEPPEEMFGKIMSIPDDVMWDYFTLATDVTVGEIDGMKSACEKGEMNPRDAKVRLGREIVTMYHSARDAEAAEEYFETVFRKKDVPEDIRGVAVRGGTRDLVDVMVEAGLSSSKSDARRVIEQGGVRVDNEVVQDTDVKMEVGDKPVLIQKGKRHFVNVRKK